MLGEPDLGPLTIDGDAVADYLREMDFTQKQTNEDGGAEIAWYYYVDGLCELLGIDYNRYVNADSAIKTRYDDEDEGV